MSTSCVCQAWGMVCLERAMFSAIRRRTRVSCTTSSPSDLVTGVGVGAGAALGADLAFLGQDLAQDAGNGGRHLCVDLVGVDLEHRLELDHLVAWLDEPLRDGAFVHRLAQLRHDDACRGGHQYAASSFRTFVILSGVGMKYSSIGTAYGIDGTSSPPNRLTGASSQRLASSAMRAATSEPTETLKLSS